MKHHFKRVILFVALFFFLSPANGFSSFDTMKQEMNDPGTEYDYEILQNEYYHEHDTSAKYIQVEIPTEFYCCGGYSITTGEETCTNTRIRLDADYSVCVHKGDYITVDSGYQVRVFVYRSNSITTESFIETIGDEWSSRVDLPEDCVGKYCVFVVRKLGYNNSDISADALTISNKIHYYHKVYNGQYLDRSRDYERFYIQTEMNGGTDIRNISTSLQDKYKKRARRCVIALPKTYSATGEPTPVIMVIHGLHGYVSSTKWCGSSPDTSEFLAMVYEYTSNGYAVFDVDQLNATIGGPSYDMGCQEQIEGYMNCWEYVKTHYNVEDQFFVQGFSQGNFAAIYIMRNWPDTVKAGLMTGVRMSIKAVYNRSDYDVQAEIAAKFGFSDLSGRTYEADKVRGFDPYAEIVWIDETTPYLQLQLPPIMAVTSKADTTDYQQAYDTLLALKNGGSQIEWRILNDVSHSDVCAGKGFVSEYRMWFDRFR